MRTVSVNIVSDFICPWCHIGDARLSRAILDLPADITVQVRWLPFELNPSMPSEGMNRREYRSRKFGSWGRSLSLDRHVVEVGRIEGIRFDYERMERTPNTFQAHRLAWLAGESNKQQEVVPRIFRAYFEEGRDIGDLHVLTEIAVESGLPPERVAEFLAGKAGSRQVRELEEALLLKNVRAVPHLEVGGTVVHGAQDSATLAEALKRGADAATPAEGKAS